MPLAVCRHIYAGKWNDELNERGKKCTQTISLHRCVCTIFCSERLVRGVQDVGGDCVPRERASGQQLPGLFPLGRKLPGMATPYLEHLDEFLNRTLNGTEYIVRDDPVQVFARGRRGSNRSPLP